MRDYTKIEACGLADDLAVEIYRLTTNFPKEELFGLTSQIRRAAVSVPANIAEGSARQSKKDYLHFLYIAMASLTETQYLSHLARRLGFLSVENAESVEAQSRRAYGCLYGLIQAVARETGFIGKLAARSTSLAAICLARLLFRPLIT